MTRINLTILFTFFISFAAFSQSNIKSDTLNQKINGKKHGYWIHKNFFKTKITSEGTYKEGVKNGIWKEYSKETPTYFHGEYTNGLREGDWYVISTKDGTKLDLQTFNKDKLIGGATLSW